MKQSVSIKNDMLSNRSGSDRHFLDSISRICFWKAFKPQRQTVPDLQHLDNWFLVVQITIWLLYLTAQEAQKVTPKWQQYLPKEKIENPVILSLAQAHKAAQNLFISFDKSPFLPKKYKKGRPRQKGEKQTPRTQYKVVRKAKKPPV